MTISNFKSYAKIFLAITFWASLYQIAPLPLHYVDIYLMALIRYILASGLLLALHYYYRGTIFPRLSPLQWMYILCVSFFGIFLYNITFLWAEKLVPGNIVAIIYAFSPCLITIASSYIFKMKINAQAALGILVALLGTIGVILFASDGADVGQCLTHFSINAGEILSLLAVFCFCAYAIFGKCSAREGVPMLTVNTYAAVIGTVMFAITSIFKSDFTVLEHTDITFWSSMIYIAVFSTVIAYIWYLQSIEEIGVYKTAIFQNICRFKL